MNEYHKIQTVYKRNPETNYKTLLEGEFSLPEFEYLKDNEWEWEEKVDGTNIRVMYDGKDVTFGGKTDRAQIPSQLVNRLNELFGKGENLQKALGDTPACLYGEGYGAKIQKGGGNYSPTQEFVLFDVNINGWWLLRKDKEVIASTLGLRIVPVIGTGTLSEMVESVRYGFMSEWGNFVAEGIVARPTVELRSRSGQRIITKIKHKDFS